MQLDSEKLQENINAMKQKADADADADANTREQSNNSDVKVLKETKAELNRSDATTVEMDERLIDKKELIPDTNEILNTREFSL